VWQITQSEPGEPCLGLMLKLISANFTADGGTAISPAGAQQSNRGMATGEVHLAAGSWPFTVDVEPCLPEPKDIPILAPIIQAGNFLRLLVGDQGARLRQMASAGSQSSSDSGRQSIG